MAGEEFIPLGVSQFSQSIQNIQKGQAGFRGDLAGRYCTGLLLRAGGRPPTSTLPMASSVNVGQGYEHKRFKAAEPEGTCT